MGRKEWLGSAHQLIWEGKNKVKEAEVNPLNTEEPNTEEKRVKGKVIKIHPDGYGFVSTKEIPFTKIYFHWTNLDHSVQFLDLKYNMKVSFIAQQIPEKGWRAIKIKAEE